MKDTNNVIAGALAGVVIGVILGAGTMQYAQLLSFSGSNPNAAKELLAPNRFQRFDGLAPTTRSIRTGEGTQPESLEFVNPQEIYGGVRPAAPSAVEEAEDCDRFGEGEKFNARRAKCIVEKRDNDVDYQQTQRPNPYK